MISIIVIVKNEEKNIVRMLKSLRGQRDFFEELIIVDEDSEDKTYSIIKSFPLFHTLVNGGKNRIGFNRNLGGNMARGDILVFTEGNCFLQKGFLKKIDEVFKDKSLVAFATSSAAYLSSGSISLIYLCYDVCRWFLTKMKLGFSISGSILVIRKNTFEELKGFGFGYNDDGVLGKKISDYCNRKGLKYIFSIDQSLAVYRSINRFHSNGIWESFTHYFYIITNFVPFLSGALKNRMLIDEVRFNNEDRIT